MQLSVWRRVTWLELTHMSRFVNFTIIAEARLFNNMIPKLTPIDIRGCNDKNIWFG